MEYGQTWTCCTYFGKHLATYKPNLAILENISFFMFWFFWVKYGTNRLCSLREVEWAHALKNPTTSTKVMNSVKSKKWRVPPY